MKWANKPGQLKPWFQGWRDGWKLDPWASEEVRKKLSGRGLMRMFGTDDRLLFDP